MTQGYPLYSTIFNMVVDTVIHHSSTMMAGKATGPEVFGRVVQNLSALFYVDDRLLDSLQPSRLQKKLDVLMGLFNRAGIKTNVGKTVGMICQLFHTPGSLL